MSSLLTTKIYALRDETRYLRYVGKTKGSLLHRLSGHLKDAQSGHRTYKCDWIRSMLSRGYLPSITLIEEVAGNGNIEERKWIKYLKDKGVKLVNGTEGGDGGAMPPEAIEKMRQKKIGKHLSIETRRKMSETRKGHLTSLETRKKISFAQRGRKKSPNQIEKNRIAHIGRWHTEETKKKMSRVHMGHSTSYLTRRKISQAQKGRPGRKKSLEEKRKISKTMILVRRQRRLEEGK